MGIANDRSALVAFRGKKSQKAILCRVDRTAERVSNVDAIPFERRPANSSHLELESKRHRLRSSFHATVVSTVVPSTAGKY
jgi:hypothetical protein